MENIVSPDAFKICTKLINELRLKIKEKHLHKEINEITRLFKKIDGILVNNFSDGSHDSIQKKYYIELKVSEHSAQLQSRCDEIDNLSTIFCEIEVMHESFFYKE
jgi:hypothetical protein